MTVMMCSAIRCLLCGLLSALARSIISCTMRPYAGNRSFSSVVLYSNAMLMMWGFAVLLLWALVGLFPADAGEGQRGKMVCAETGAFFIR